MVARAAGGGDGKESPGRSLERSDGSTGAARSTPVGEPRELRGPRSCVGYEGFVAL